MTPVPSGARKLFILCPCFHSWYPRTLVIWDCLFVPSSGVYRFRKVFWELLRDDPRRSEAGELFIVRPCFHSCYLNVSHMRLFFYSFYLVVVTDSVGCLEPHYEMTPVPSEAGELFTVCPWLQSCYPKTLVIWDCFSFLLMMSIESVGYLKAPKRWLQPGSKAGEFFYSEISECVTLAIQPNATVIMIVIIIMM